MRTAAPLALVAALVLVVAGCASTRPVSRVVVAPVADEPFAIEGRLSARRGTDAVSFSFAWTHAAPHDELIVTTPLGGAVAEISGDASRQRVEVRTADGRRDAASDWAELTTRAVGYPLPIEGLVFWLRGAPRSDASHTAELDASGRVDVLRQDGCEIVYAYADDLTHRPSRLRLACHDIELRIAIDRWRAA